jgi:hypothetical protein
MAWRNLTPLKEWAEYKRDQQSARLAADLLSEEAATDDD